MPENIDTVDGFVSVIYERPQNMNSFCNLDGLRIVRLIRKELWRENFRKRNGSG